MAENVSGSTAPIRSADTAAPRFQDLVTPVPGAVRKDSVITEQHPVPSSGARWAAEFSGTMLLIFAGVGTGVFAAEIINSALGFGFGLLAALVAFGHVSGGHFNPAVTLGAVVAGRTPAVVALGYVVAQVLGALVAVGLLWAVLVTVVDSSTTAQLLGAVANGYGENSSTQAGLSTVLLIEFVASILFVLVVLGSTAPRANAVLAPVAIAAAFAFLLAIVTPFDGGSLNPARSTGVAVVGGVESLSQLWLFWVAPLLGGLVAGLLHRMTTPNRTDAASARSTTEDTTVSTGTDTPATRGA